MPPKSKKAPASQANAPRPLPANNTTKASPQPPTVAKHTQTGTGQAISTNGAQSSIKADSTAKEQESGTSAPAAPTQINRKKQKRREKEAAKRAAEQTLSNGYSEEHGSMNGQSPYSAQGMGPPRGYFNEEPEYIHPDFADDTGDLDDHFYSGDDEPGFPENSAVNHDTWTQGQSSRKKRKDKDYNDLHTSASLARTTGPSRSQLAPLSNAAFRSAHRMTGESIWNTSTQAERENIKQFWLELGEEERRSLVKVEKEAVLRKMKEQQKHSCSCSVCGRKRTAIEEELEVLYDAYYEELEQFANHNNDLTNAPQLMAPPRSYRQLRGPAHPMAGSYPQRGRVLGEDDDDGLDDDEDYDEDDEPYSDEDIDDLPPGAPDFFTFGNSLTVKDGILTVADDLLKNDGKHFIDMMEQLAERRMQREEEIHYPSAALAHQTVHQGHNHPPLDEDDDYDDDEDDDEYDSQEEDYDEGDEMDSMTEEQRMEEGRRMFQIFAARMFEQRVLTAYREKVARERQQKLLEELDEESRLDTQREAKKAKEAAKKKEKKRLQKLAKDEDKAKKDAEKSAQEAAAREVEERKLEEQRQRKEEQRKKREAEKKAAEEERLRKEAEKQRRAQDEREKQAEIDRKQKEAREKEKKKRDEARKKEREEREAKEKEAKERKAKEEQDRKAKDEQARKEKDGVGKADRDAKDRTRQEQANRRQPVALPPGLYPPTHPSHVQSPHFQVVTPIMPPKVPTPNRNRQPSQPGQQSHGSSPRSQQANTDNSRSSGSPATIAIPQTPGLSNAHAKAQVQPPTLHHPQPSAPLSPLSSQGRGGQQHFTMNGMPGLGMNGPPISGSGMMPGMAAQMPMYQGPPMGGPQRFGPPQGMPYPPGFSGPRHFPTNQQLPFHTQGPMQMPMSAPQNQAPKPPSHSRQQSDSNADLTGQPAPIGRPGPIGRPSSTTPDKQKAKRRSSEFDVDHLTTQLGSKALLDDSDLPLSSDTEPKAGLPPLGAPGSGRAPFSSSFGEHKHDSFGLPGQTWSSFSPNMPNAGSWGHPGSVPRQNAGWPQTNNNAFGAIGGGMSNMTRPNASRPVAIRLMLVQACKQLSPASGMDSYIPVQNVLRQVDMAKTPNEAPVSMDEMLAICDTEGNAQNGGGSFEIRNDPVRGQVVKFEPDGVSGGRNSVGDIGSPISTHGQLASFGGIGQGFGPPGRAF